MTQSYSWCVPEWGSQALGESCQRPTNKGGLDTCAPHLLCGNWGQASQTERVCRALCVDEAGCETDESCIQFGVSPGKGVCVPGCTPFGAGCASGNQCAPIMNAEGKTDFFCGFIGAATQGEKCSAAGTCAENFWCVGTDTTCHQKCDVSHPCPDDFACYTMVQDQALTGACFPLDWSCTAQPWPAPVASEATIKVSVSDYVQGGIPVQGATVKACAAGDPQCATPLVTASTGDDGTASLKVQVGSSGFDGYFEVSAQGLVPILRAHNRPITAENTTELAFGMANQAAYQAAEAPAGFTIDFTRGMVEVASYDCAAVPVAGVVVTATGTDASSKIAYVKADWSAADDTLTSTSAAGVAAVLNVPGSSTTITATRASDSKVVGSATAPLRPGHVTELRVFPEP